MFFLVEGFEGRFFNLVVFFFDVFCRLDVDLGVDNLFFLEWKFEKEYVIDYVVLGKGKVGGVW